MPRKDDAPDYADEEEKPEDLRCKKCRKPVLIGHGNQRETKKGQDRFCNTCWSKCVEETW